MLLFLYWNASVLATFFRCISCRVAILILKRIAIGLPKSEKIQGKELIQLIPFNSSLTKARIQPKKIWSEYTFPITNFGISVTPDEESFPVRFCEPSPANKLLAYIPPEIPANQECTLWLYGQFQNCAS